MAGECVSHVNGYKVKDAESRKKLSELETDVRLARQEATEARQKSLQNEGEVQSARQEAAQAATAARTAFNTANAALPKTGGTMEGSVNMGGKALTNAVNLGGQVLFLENKNGTGEVTAEANTTPGVVNFQHWKKPAPGDVIIRGIANPTNDNDAASKAYVDKTIANAAPFYVEETRVTLVEGVPNEIGEYNEIPNMPELKIGKGYAIYIDDEKYPLIGLHGDSDTNHELRAFYHNRSSMAWVYENKIVLNIDFFDITAPHKIEMGILEYHTSHDFMVVSIDDSYNEVTCIDLVAGDYAAAKEKIDKGFPVTVMFCFTASYGGDLVKTNEVATATLVNGEDSFFGVKAETAEKRFCITPDNTVYFD